MCANGEIVNCTDKYLLEFQLGSHSVCHNFIAVPNLNADAILGMDFVESFQFSDKDPFVTVNDQKLPLAKFDAMEFGKLKKSVRTTPFDLNLTVEVKNPFFNDPSVKSIFCDKLINQKHNKFVFNPSLNPNSETISVCLSNLREKSCLLPKNFKICTLEPIREEIPKVSGIKCIDCTDEEIQEFHNSRVEKFGEISDFNFGSIGSKLTDVQKEKLLSLFREKELALARTGKDVGKLFNYSYTLPMFDEKDTAYAPPRPVPPNLLPKVEAEIAKFEELGIIEPSESGFNIPLLILKKSDGTLRVSLDARQLNSKLKPDRFPLPSMPELLSKVSNRLSKGKECYVTALDINKAYWQLPIDPTDSHKISFSFKNKHFKSKRMLYGLSTAPAAWSKVMQDIFGENDKILLYLDDILIISSSFEEHIADLRWFLDKCISNGLTLSQSKIKLCNTSFDFLGHHIDEKGIKPKISHIESIQNFPRPTDKASLKRFLGMAQFNAKMVKNASATMAPLHRLTSGKNIFYWTDEHQKAFDQIKSDLASTNGLAHRNLDYPLYLTTDASGSRAGATLYQKSPSGDFQVVGYYSSVFTKPEMRLSSRHREILALCFGIKHFEFHLIGTKFSAIVDHKSLLYLFREHFKTTLSTKMVNVLCYLQNFEFDLLHYAGSSPIMASADFMSRLPISTIDELERESREDDLVDKVFILTHLPDTQMSNSSKIFLRKFAGQKEPEQDPIDKEIVLKFEDFEFSRSEMKELQEKCSFCSNILRKIDLASKNTFNKFVLKNGLLYRKIKNGTKLVLPESKTFEFISYVHTLYVHPGHKALIKIIQKFVFISNLYEKCLVVLKNCLPCISDKTKCPLRPEAIKPKAYEALPFSKVGIDLYDLGKPDRNKKRYLFTLTDHLTSYVDGVPISNKTDACTSKAFQSLILRHGVCGQVILDNGKEFAGPIFQDLAKKFNLQLHYSSPYNSRSNSRAERSHRDILIKQKLLGTNRKNWSSTWPFIQCILNNTPRESLNGKTSSECVYGRATHHALTYELAKEESPKSDFSEAMSQYFTKLWPELLQLQLNRYTKFMDTHENSLPKLSKGDYVLIWKPKVLDGKLSTLWDGPYRILRNYSKTSFHLINPETGLKLRRHIRHIRPIGKIMTEKLKNDYVADDENEHNSTNSEEVGDFHDFSDFPFPN